MVKLNKLVKEVKYCSYFESNIGLMFSSKRDRALVFTFDKEKIIPLHMFFVFYAIDAVFLDKNKKIVEIKRNFKPFTFFFPKKKAKYIIELPLGKARLLKIGKKIEF